MSRLDVLADILQHIRAGYTVRWNPVSKATCRSVARLTGTSLHVRALQKHVSIVTQCECTYENIDAACNSILQYRHADFESDELNGVRDRLRCFARLVVYSGTADAGTASPDADGGKSDSGIMCGGGKGVSVGDSGCGGGSGDCRDVTCGDMVVIDRDDAATTKTAVSPAPAPETAGTAKSDNSERIGLNMHSGSVSAQSVSGMCWADTMSDDTMSDGTMSDGTMSDGTE